MALRSCLTKGVVMRTSPSAPIFHSRIFIEASVVAGRDVRLCYVAKFRIIWAHMPAGATKQDPVLRYHAVMGNSRAPLQISVVHEWLVEWGGSEDCVRLMLECFPQAQLHATIDFLSA